MTSESFKELIRRQSKGRILGEYLSCLIFIGIGVLILYNYYAREGFQNIYIYLLPTIPIFIGVRGIFQIGKIYNKIETIKSALPVSDKIILIKNCFVDFKKVEITINDSFLLIKYPFFFYNKIEVNFYVGIEEVFFISRREDGQPIADLIDLGATKKENKLIRERLIACL